MDDGSLGGTDAARSRLRDRTSIRISAGPLHAPCEAHSFGPAENTGRATVLLFLSGAASLVFETLWVKQLGLVIGVDVHEVTVALSAFFAGLAAGAFVFGRGADRSPRPMRFYAVLEVAAGLAGAMATFALAHAARGRRHQPPAQPGSPCRLRGAGPQGEAARPQQYVSRYGDDMPEIRDWR